MAITVGYEDPAALGMTAYQAGLGEYAKYQQDQAMRERAMVLNEAQFAEQQAQNDFRNRFAVEELNRSTADRRRGQNIGYLTAQQQLALRQQALQQDAMTRAAYNQTQLAEQFMRQQGQEEAQRQATARQQMQIMAQAERERQSQRARQASADWDAIQKARADGRTFLNEGHYQQAVEQWQNRYGGMYDAMPIDLPYVEQPDQNPLVPFLEWGSTDDDGPAPMPVDPNTGEMLIDPRDYVQIVQAKNQRIQANRKADIEAQKADQDAIQEQLTAGFKQAEAQQKQQEASIKQAAAFGDKLAETIVSNYYQDLSKYDSEVDAAPPKKPKFPAGQTISVEQFRALYVGGFIKHGTQVFIAGHGPLDWGSK